jgi:deoxycytidine triphosphate deaminase
MRLMTAKDILGSVRDPSGPLQIGGFSDDYLQHSAYYIRLGDRYSRMDDENLVDVDGALSEHNLFLGFEPSEYVRVSSRESFRLSGTVFGILGGVSDTPRRGLALVSGQFIDPLYPGDTGEFAAPLELGLKNESRLHASIRRADVIAKVCFFDVSDSTEMEVLSGSLADRKFIERRIHAMDAQFRKDPI